MDRSSLCDADLLLTVVKDPPVTMKLGRNGCGSVREDPRCQLGRAMVLAPHGSVTGMWDDRLDYRDGSFCVRQRKCHDLRPMENSSGWVQQCNKLVSG